MTPNKPATFECLVCGHKYQKRFADVPELGCPRCADVKVEQPDLFKWVQDVVRIAVADHLHSVRHGRAVEQGDTDG